MNNRESDDRVRLLTPGKVTVTRAAAQAMWRVGATNYSLLVKHLNGDWGGVDTQTRAENEMAEDSGQGAICSLYFLCDGTRIWVTTCLNPHHTTIRLADEA